MDHKLAISHLKHNFQVKKIIIFIKAFLKTLKKYVSKLMTILSSRVNHKWCQYQLRREGNWQN